MAPAGSSIAYVVSLGVGTTEVPNVVGLKGTTAKADLEEAGFLVTVEEEFSSSIKSGLVISQNPKAGLTVGAGSEIVIVVSKGTEPETVLVPDVVDMTEDAAVQALKARGLKADITYDPSGTPTGLVLEQDPPGGTKVAIDSTVSLIVDASGN